MMMMQLVSYLDLWVFMKFGPCLRNSVVSPKSGQPIVPGGKPFFLYLTSFHLKRAEQKQSSKTTPTTIVINKAIGAPTPNPTHRDFKKKVQPLLLQSPKECTQTHIYRPLELGYHLHIRIRINHKDKKPALYNMVVASLILCLVIKI